MKNKINLSKLLNTQIIPTYIGESKTTVKEYLKKACFDLINENYDEALTKLGTLQVNFAEKNLIDGFVARDEDGYLVDYEYNQKEADMLLKSLVDVVFNGDFLQKDYFVRTGF